MFVWYEYVFYCLVISWSEERQKNPEVKACFPSIALLHRKVVQNHNKNKAFTDLWPALKFMSKFSRCKLLLKWLTDNIDALYL